MYGDLDEKTIGYVIKKSRLMLGMNQDELAKMLGIKRANINYYKSNLVLPSGRIILKLVDIIGSGDLIKDSYCKFIINNSQNDFLI